MYLMKWPTPLRNGKAEQMCPKVSPRSSICTRNCTIMDKLLPSLQQLRINWQRRNCNKSKTRAKSMQWTWHLTMLKRRQRGQQSQGNCEQYDNDGSGYSNECYDDQSEEAQYFNNYQGNRGNSSNQQWRPQGNWGNQQQGGGNWNNNNQQQGGSNWNNNNQNNNWGNQGNQGNWNGNNNNWGNNNNQGGWNNNGNQGNRGMSFQRPPMYQQPSNPPPFPSQGPSSSVGDMGRIESMFKQMMKKNQDSDAQLASHNTSIRNLEVQLGQISQALNTHPKGALPSDMVVNPKGGNKNHVMAVTTRSGRGGDVNASKQKQVVDEDIELRDDNVPLVVEDVVEENVNNDVRIDIDEAEVETQDVVNPSREHVIDMPEPIVPKAKAP
ncbi:uncharacterized protein [Nicotiana sylvestris]|uniref:uncharacterized protein isoform X1 n=1 Tax=Nicotiana sylvestris TaxID=4096 RepID=UPI00388C7C7F